MSICQPYYDEYSRPTDLMHVAKGATYPINILGNAATADVANNPIEDLAEDSEDTISFRSGVELESKANEFTHKITRVAKANDATNDSAGNNIIETYARKDEVVRLDPETGKVPTEYLPDTANNVNFVNGKTGDVELTALDIPYDETKSTKEQLDDIVEDTNEAINNLNESKADRTEIPLVGKELYATMEQDSPVINAYKYEASQVGNDFRLIKKNTTDSTEEIVSQFGINANAIFAFAPQAQVFDISTNFYVGINWARASVYNMAYLEMLDKSTGTWHIRNDGNKPIYVMRFGGRFNSGARISPMPHGEYINPNNEITFYLDSDDPYLDRNSFGLLVWKLGE